MYVSLKEIMKITTFYIYDYVLLYTHVLFFKGILLRLCVYLAECVKLGYSCILRVGNFVYCGLKVSILWLKVWIS